MRKGAASLLPAGVVSVTGVFKRGDIVDVVAQDATRVASGIVNYDSADVRKVQGQHSEYMAGALEHLYGDEIIHRNNMVVL